MLSLRHSLALALLLTPGVSYTASPQARGTTLIRHVRVFDGERVIGVRDVLVRDGRIAAVESTIAVPRGADVVDGAGKTLLPGLIDAHTHVFGDALAQALAFGVTTELDMFTDPKLATQMRAEQTAGNVASRADLYSAGVLATAPHGHGTEYGMAIPTIAAAESAQAFVDARVAEGSDYIKIILDDGSTYGRTIPTVSTATLRALVRAAHARHKLAVVHVGTLADARAAIDAGADGLMHLFLDREPDPEFGRFVAAHHAFVVPTLTVLRSVAGTPDGAALVSDARLSPYLSATGQGSLLGTFRFARPMNYAAAEHAVQQLKAAHVPILACTDAPNPGTAHGISIHRELELLVAAGLTPTEALVAGTSAPARAFSLGDRGMIAAGRRADLLLVQGDPTTNILATRAIISVWKGGTLLDRAAVASAVAAQRTAVATGTPLGMVSSFESGTPAANYGFGWVVTTDQLAGGKSTATMNVVGGGAAGTSKSLEVAGDIDAGLPYAWGGAMFMPGVRPMAAADFSKAKEIRFWAKGDGHTYHVMVFAESRGRMPLMNAFVAGPEWTEIVMPISSFAGIDGHDVMGVAFTGGPEPGPFKFRIDEVRIQ